jgi:sugar/nucleoside kinase (ribokinase family)
MHALPKAAKNILERGPKQLIIKRGEHGSLLFDSEGTFWCPAAPLDDAVDPTGAGDTFAGALVGYLASTGDLSAKNMRRATMVGAAVASFCVQAIGTARLARLNREDVVGRVNAIRQLMDYGGVAILR